MNKVLLVGRFKTIWHEEGKGFRFNVSMRRSYKNKETGKYDWDNVSVSCPAFNKSTIKFIEDFIEDGDLVEMEGHVNTYSTENEKGEKSYHQELVCDQIKNHSSKGPGKSDDVVSEEKITADSGCPDGFEEADIDDEDCPF